MIALQALLEARPPTNNIVAWFGGKSPQTIATAERSTALPQNNINMSLGEEAVMRNIFYFIWTSYSTIPHHPATPLNRFLVRCRTTALATIRYIV
jgi:hypothetical protein